MTTRARELRDAFDRGFATAAAPADAPRTDFLRIELAGQRAAIPLGDIASLHVDLRIVALPTRTPALLGVAAIRAAVVPIYDLGAALGRAGAGATRWVVLIRGGQAGFAFASFDGHARIPEASIAAATPHGQLVLDGQLHAIIDLGFVWTALGRRERNRDRQRTKDMLRNWTFGRKVGGGFAVAVVALVVIAVAGLRSARSLILNDARVAHTHQVRRQLAELLSQLVNAETGQRGFVITAQDAFLEPYTAALGAIDKIHAEVRRLTIDNPEQTRRLDELRPVIDDKLAWMKRTIEQRRTTSLDATAAVIAGGEGRQSMVQIRAIVGAMDDEEHGLLDRRQREAEASTETTKLIIEWGGVAAVLATILVGWLITTTLARRIGSVARQMQSSSTELQAASNQQATGAREQATAMAEIATTISELLATSRQISDSSKRVAQIAGQTAGAARAGEITVTRGHEASTAIRQQVDLIVGHMLELGKKSQQVGTVLDIVTELAEQTNILAINATIEAAGAGETGRRFGVVADEIRKLADRVAGSTKEIRGMVEDVRRAVNTTVMATEAGSKAVDVGTAQVVEMATAFRQIASLVGTTTDAAREIELSTKQQATAVEQINAAISDVAQATREAEASSGQALQTASQLAAMSRDLARLVQPAASA